MHACTSLLYPLAQHNLMFVFCAVSIKCVQQFDLHIQSIVMVVLQPFCLPIANLMHAHSTTFVHDCRVLNVPIHQPLPPPPPPPPPKPQPSVPVVSSWASAARLPVQAAASAKPKAAAVNGSVRAVSIWSTQQEHGDGQPPPPPPPKVRQLIDWNACRESQFPGFAFPCRGSAEGEVACAPRALMKIVLSARFAET